MIAPGLRVVAALRAGSVLVARPRGTVHIHAGRLTRKGATVPTGVRPFCGVRSRRLRVVGHSGDLSVLGARTGRRFCRRCIDRLPAVLGVDDRQQLVTRDDWLTAYGTLTAADLTAAAVWCRTVDEAHQVSRVILMQFGPKPLNRFASPRATQLWDLHERVEVRRRRLVNRDRTEAERAQIVAMRDAEAADRQRTAKARRQEAAIDRAHERRRAGTYMTPYEKGLVGT